MRHEAHSLEVNVHLNLHLDAVINLHADASNKIATGVRVYWQDAPIHMFGASSVGRTSSSALEDNQTNIAARRTFRGLSWHDVRDVPSFRFLLRESMWIVSTDSSVGSRKPVDQWANCLCIAGWREWSMANFWTGSNLRMKSRYTSRMGKKDCTQR